MIKDYLNTSFTNSDRAEKIAKEVAEHIEFLLKDSHFKFFKKGEFQADEFQDHVFDAIFGYLEDEDVSK